VGRSGWAANSAPLEMSRRATPIAPLHPSRQHIPSAIADQARSQIIQENPIREGLNTFRASFGLIYKGASIPYTPDSLGRLGHEGKNDSMASFHVSLLTILQTYRISPLIFF
jgi:hypothetical protein